MYKRILVPLDGSETAERILPHVEAIAQATGAEVILFRTAYSSFQIASDIVTEAPTEARKMIEAEEARSAKYLEGVAKRLQDVGLKTRLEVLVGEPAVEILTAAEKDDVDLIALMSHGSTAINKFDLGSVAHKVLKASTRPVLMVRAFRSLLRQLDEQEVWAIK